MSVICIGSDRIASRISPAVMAAAAAWAWAVLAAWPMAPRPAAAALPAVPTLTAACSAFAPEVASLSRSADAPLAWVLSTRSTRDATSSAIRHRFRPEGLLLVHHPQSRGLHDAHTVEHIGLLLRWDAKHAHDTWERAVIKASWPGKANAPL
ncbi:Uncharacterised protein [Bordetella pertussis]|nr:Uncharacterised protein [Bordetella pertussis]